MSSAEKPVKLAKVDATVEKKVADRFQIQGFPTLKWFVSGNAIEYNGGRTEKEIVSWVTKRTGDVSKNLETIEAVREFIEKAEVALIYFGADSEESFAAYKATAMGSDDLTFAHTSLADAASEFANGAKVVLFKSFDEKRNDFSGELTTDNLNTFIDQNSFPLVMPFNDRAIEKVFQKGNPTLFLFASENEASTEAEKLFAEAAKELKGNQVIFSITKPNDGFGHFQRLADYVGVNTAQAPQMMLIHTTQDVNKYKFEAGITKENITNFVNDFNNGKLELYLKSEEVPATNDEPVKVIVGKNFNEIVRDSNQDVLLEFYAPWCGHCKQLEPKYNEVAKRLIDNKNLVIAKIDATANEVPGISVRGFPTIKFFPANNKSSPVDFDGARDEEGIINWLKDHVTHPWPSTEEAPKETEKEAKEDL